MFGTVPRTRSNAREAAADLWALLINRAEAGLRVKEYAVPAAPLFEHKELRGRVEGPDRTLGVELPEDLFKRCGGFVLSNQLKSHQIDGADFDG